MEKYRCPKCNYCYDPEMETLECAPEGEFPCEPVEVFYDHENAQPTLPQLAFKDLADSWCCPHCGGPKKDFKPEDGKECKDHGKSCSCR